MRLIDCFMEPLTFTEYLLKGENTTKFSYDDVWKQYDRLFLRAHECVQKNGFPEAERLSAFFAVCAWVDERILCSDWSGQEKWAFAPLQRIHFGTTNAGEEFFQRLEYLAEDNHEVREVYVYILALGFKGNLFSPEKGEALKKITAYHIGLLDNAGEPEIGGKLFPGAYDKELKKRTGKRWFYLFSFAKLPFILMPVIIFATLFFLYRWMLQKITAGFIGTAF